MTFIVCLSSWGCTLEIFILGGSARRCNRWPFCISVWQKSYLYWKKVLVSHVYLRTVHRFSKPLEWSWWHYYGRTSSITRRDVNQKTSIICSVHVVMEVKILRFPDPFIYLNLWNAYFFVYLKPEKGTLFGRSLHVEVIIGTTLSPEAGGSA